jgi:hypothetical protein
LGSESWPDLADELLIREVWVHKAGADLCSTIVIKSVGAARKLVRDVRLGHVIDYSEPMPGHGFVFSWVARVKPSGAGNPRGLVDRGARSTRRRQLLRRCR